MNIYNIKVLTKNYIQSDVRYIDNVTLSGSNTIYDYFKFLVIKNELAKWNTYTYNNKCLGYDYPLKTKISSLFWNDNEPVVKELSFIVPMNPFKRVNWILALNNRNIFDIVNLDGIDPLNKFSIGTWHGWGKLSNKLDKKNDNCPSNLIIIRHFKRNYAYNKFKLLDYINKSPNKLILPHNDVVVNKSILKNKLHLFRETLAIINI